MSAAIVERSGAGSIWAQKVLGYRVERRSRNTVHNVVGGGTAVSLLPSNARSGRLELLIPNEASALDAFNLLSAGKEYNFRSAERPALNMWFAVDDNAVTIELDPTTLDHWIIGFGFQELV